MKRSTVSLNLFSIAMRTFSNWALIFTLSHQGLECSLMSRAMTEPTDGLNLTIKQLASELRLLEKRLRVEPDPSAEALTELRHALDDARLTAWSVSTLITAGRPGQVRNAALAFVAAERIRRAEQLVKNICADIAGRAITLQKNQMDSLLNSVNSLREVLMHSLAESEHL
jgi:hypothetical protein